MAEMKKNRLYISPVESGDLPEVAEVYRHSPGYLVDVSGEAPESIGPELVARESAEAREHGALFFGIRLERSNKVIGVATCKPSGYQGDFACAWIALLMIAEPFQRQGYGEEAYRLIEELVFSNRAILTIKLGVLPNNPIALAFWHRMGYVESGSGKCKATGQEMVLMQKQKIDLKPQTTPPPT
jgi:RimJ/RimL family protein N-acetyltransferase